MPFRADEELFARDAGYGAPCAGASLGIADSTIDTSKADVRTPGGRRPAPPSSTHPAGPLRHDPALGARGRGDCGAR